MTANTAAGSIGVARNAASGSVLRSSAFWQFREQ